MASPPPRAATGPLSNTIQAEAKQPETDSSRVYSHSDPTFEEVARRLDWGVGDWTLRGPSFEDGTYPIIHIDWRLGELLMRLLMRYAEARLSREQRKQLRKGEPLERIRLVKENTPTAATFGDRNSDEGHTQEDLGGSSCI